MYFNTSYTNPGEYAISKTIIIDCFMLLIGVVEREILHYFL